MQVGAAAVGRHVEKVRRGEGRHRPGQFGVVGGSHVGIHRAEEDALRAEGDDQGGQVETGDDHTVDESEDGSDGDGHREDAGQSRIEPEGQAERHRGVPREDRDRGEGDVDASGDHHDEHTEGEHHRHDRATQDREAGVERKEGGVRDGHPDDKQDQHEGEDALVVGTPQFANAVGEGGVHQADILSWMVFTEI